MDPYLEVPALWPDVHNTLIVSARELLLKNLGAKYYVRIEDRVYISAENDAGRTVRVPDIRVAMRRTGNGVLATSGVQLAEPEIYNTLLEEEIHEPYLAVIDQASGQVVTLIEVLSPSNKAAGAEGRRSYQEKRAGVLKSPTHWVEIDLLRTGIPTVARAAYPYDYLIHVSDAEERPRGRVYRVLLADRLPVFGIPLLPGDNDAPLDLQQALELSYERAGYDRTVDYGAEPTLPLTPEQASWADALLKEKGLR